MQQAHSPIHTRSPLLAVSSSLTFSPSTGMELLSTTASLLDAIPPHSSESHQCSPLPPGELGRPCSFTARLACRPTTPGSADSSSTLLSAGVPSAVGLALVTKRSNKHRRNSWLILTSMVPCRIGPPLPGPGCRTKFWVSLSQNWWNNRRQ
jgi:hypothetical protein